MIPLHSFFKHDLPADIALAARPLPTSAEPQAISQLGEAEINQFKALGKPKRQIEFLTGRLLLKELAKAQGLGAITISNHPDTGAPEAHTPEGTAIEVSLAHTKGMIMAGMSPERALGVDLEPAEREVHPRLTRRMLHPDEQQELASVEPIRIWTLKEATVKLMKTGLRKNLNEVCITRHKSGTFRCKNELLPTEAHLHSTTHRQHIFTIAYLPA